MEKEINEKKLNQERVEYMFSNLNTIWIEGGYTREFDDEIYMTPFEMGERITESGDSDYIEAFSMFRSNLLRSQVGQRYVRDFIKENPNGLEVLLRENAQDEFWEIEDCSDVPELVSNIGQMSHKDEKGEDSNLSALFVKALMSDYILRDEEIHNGPRDRYREIPLENRKYLIYKYFENYGVRDLEYWSSQEGVTILYQYVKNAGTSPVDYLRGRLDTYNITQREKSNEYEERMENFESMWSLLELPGFVEGKYDTFRKSFIKKLKEPSLSDMHYQVLGRGRKNPYINMLNRIYELSKDKENIHREVAEKFFSNILFDPELFILADGLRKIDEENSNLKFIKKHPINIKFDEIFESSMNNPEFIGVKWFTSGGEKTLKEIYSHSPELFMQIVDSYLDKYCNDLSLSRKQQVELGAIISRLFSWDIKSLTQEAYEKTQQDKIRYKENRIEKLFKIVFGKEFEEKRLADNEEIFASTQEWADFWKGSKNIRNFGKLFKKNENLFNTVIEGLMSHSPTTKSANFFDNISMINRLGKKMAEESAKAGYIEDDPLGDVRDETERLILKRAFEACTVPEVRITVKGKEGDIDTINQIYQEFQRKYGEIVQKIHQDSEIPELTIDEEGIISFKTEITDESYSVLSSLGFEIEDREGESVIIAKPQEFLDRVLGILISPTLYEWREDDKYNINPRNDRVRSLFFVPKNIDVIYVEDGEINQQYSLNHGQKSHYIQNYLQWYIKSKYLSGDIASLNTVVSAWLADDPHLRRDIETQKRDMKDKLNGIWSDFTEALSITYRRVRDKRDGVLERFLLATNIEELLPFITSDVIQVSTLSSAILSASLEAAKEARLSKNLMQVNSTLSKQFEGSLSVTYLAPEKHERVKKALKKLGFEESEAGLQMFRNIWTNLWYLRGTRGNDQTLTISTEGISISNPSHTMYTSEIKENRGSKGEVTKEVVRKYQGGKDKVSVSWSQIRSVGEVDFDYNVFVDLSVKLLTTYASVFGKSKRPPQVQLLEEEGPANIVVRLPGRDEPLFEIFAVKRPKEVWRSIKGMAELMEDEEGVESIRDLLDLLHRS